MKTFAWISLFTVGVLLPHPPHVSETAVDLRPITISGRVIDAESGRPLAGAQVYIPGEGRGSLAATDGGFQIVLPDDFANTEVELVAELIGFTTQRVTITLSDPHMQVDFSLSPTAVTLDELVVTGTAQPRARPKLGFTPTVVRGSQSTRLVPPAMAGEVTPDWNREQYAHISDNRFLGVANNPLSTFSIDVDRASYANVRRYLMAGSRPPVGAVRIEEMINYFSYDQRGEAGEHPFSVTSEVAPAPWNREHRLVRIGLHAPEVETRDLPRSNLVFLLDVSGSMSWPDKLPLLKESLGLLVRNLREEDRVSIVVYAGAAGLVLPPTSGANKGAILEALDRLSAGGSTAGGAGLQLAYDVAAQNFDPEGNNRVILATDGDFNVGPSSDAAMVELIEARREEGTFLTVLGFGTGNLQDAKMEQIADHGNGNFAYIDRLTEARKVLISEMGGTLFTVAKDVKLQVEFNPAVVQAYRLIGYENRLLAHEDFVDDTKDAGEIGAGHAVTALYEVVPVGAPTPEGVASVGNLRYQERGDVTGSDELLFVKMRYKQPDQNVSTEFSHAVIDRDSRSPSEDFRFAAAVAGFGMLLRDSEYCGDLTTEDVLDLARSGLGADPGGLRTEFVDLVRRFETVASIR